MFSERYSCNKISTELLQYNSRWDIHPFLERTEPVSQSPSTIAQIGLLKPPLVVAIRKGNYEFLTGWREFNYLQSVSPQSSIWCRVLSHHASITSILTHLYQDYNSIQPLNPIEPSWFISLCRNNITSTDDLEKLFTFVGLKSNKISLDRIEKLLMLETEIQCAMMRGAINEKIARELLQFSTNDRLALFALFTDLGLGTGKQRRVLSILRDLAGRKGTSCTAILNEPEFDRILQHPEMNTPQKSQALLGYLQDTQTPTLNRALDSFNTWRERLELPENQEIKHSVNFEKDELFLSIRFQNRAHIEKYLPVIRKLTEKNN
jgi:hypothetical protein